MKAILIDPFTRSITEVEYSGNYQQIYDLIDAECFDVARINKHGDGIFVDDEGLLHDKEQCFFLHEDYPMPLAGKGLVLGCDDEGESVSPHTTLDELRLKVTFGEPINLGSGQLGWIQYA